MKADLTVRKLRELLCERYKVVTIEHLPPSLIGFMQDLESADQRASRRSLSIEEFRLFKQRIEKLPDLDFTVPID